MKKVIAFATTAALVATKAHGFRVGGVASRSSFRPATARRVYSKTDAETSAPNGAAADVSAAPSFEEYLKERESIPVPPGANINVYTTGVPPPSAQSSNNGAVAPQDGEVGEIGLQQLIYFGLAFLGLPLWLLLSSQVFNAPVTPSVVPVAPAPAPVTIVMPPATPAAPPAPSMAMGGSAGVVVMSQPITKAEVRGLFDLWNDALKTGDPATVAERYAREGVLLPTLSDVPRTDVAGIKDYFVGFLSKRPTGKILEGEIYIGNNWAQDAGIYEFTFQDGSKVKARYSFVYVYEDGQWLISHHHSSLMPQEVVKPVAITKEEVRAFFDLWNDALKTGDPMKVADRYTSDAVLLPTLSNRARYDRDGIADYFVGFLAKKPTGRILEGNVKLGPNWAQDAGIYEFAFQDGSTVQGRYSFIYSYENGVWKISNHHSSMMPEGMVKKQA